MGNVTRGELVLLTVDDAVGNFIHDDRKNDIGLPRGAIQKALKADEVTINQIVERFRQTLVKRLGE